MIHFCVSDNIYSAQYGDMQKGAMHKVYLKTIKCRRLETKSCSVRNGDFGFHRNTKHQLKTIQKSSHNLAYMDYAMIFV